MNFNSLGLSQPLLDAIESKGYSTPSPIQAKSIPPVLEGADLMAAAQTGTGKTASFALPILERLSQGTSAQANQVRCLVLVPTRELAAQVAESFETYGKNLSLRSTVVFGGVKINPQMMKLRRGADVLIATPGRLLDLYQQNAIKFKQLEILVLDEADRMLDMGFIRDLRKITALLPKVRQNLLFSATFSDDIRELARSFLSKPIEISVSPENSTAKTVKQAIYSVDKKRKSALLAQLIKDNNWWQVLVFTRTKHGANRLTRFLEGQGLKAAAIHGNKSQGARTRALESFKKGDIGILVATDIAARGLDIDQLPQVVNFELPSVSEDYVHRIGRTGRAGAEGQAISLVCADEFKQLTDIERLIQKLLERKIYEGFAPVNALPESKLNTRPKKIKKPKKPKTHKSENSQADSPKRPSRRSPAKPKYSKPSSSDEGQRFTEKKKKTKSKDAPSKSDPNKNRQSEKPSTKHKTNSGYSKKNTNTSDANKSSARPQNKTRSPQKTNKAWKKTSIKK